jgi:hypothetical protein
MSEGRSRAAEGGWDDNNGPIGGSDELERYITQKSGFVGVLLNDF